MTESVHSDAFEREFFVNLTEVAMAAAITLSVAGVSYAALNNGDATRQAEEVAAAADCRAVETAIVGYVAQYGTTPTRTAQLTPFVDGDITAYRIVRGRASGPGC
ncbi:hypothetical protein [Actinoplanes sp. NPDC051494]|uniref:hypothetical protein n=1 Tax=Actinoplanes sp. NPDC051494 TaxID=3363907 RepID=UPI0037BDC343